MQTRFFSRRENFDFFPQFDGLSFFIFPACFPLYYLRHSFCGGDRCHQFLRSWSNLKEKRPRVMLTQPWQLYYFLLPKFLLCCGDINPNLGPIIYSYDMSENIRDYKNSIKILQLICRILNKKRSSFKKKFNFCGLNTVFGFTEK